MKLQALRGKRTKALQVAAAILDKAEAEGRELTAEERTQWDTHKAESDRLKGDIVRAEQLETELADDARPRGRQTQPDRVGAGPAYARGEAPYVTTGPVGRDSQGYSFLRAVGYANGFLREDQAKEEVHVNAQLQELYHHHGFVPQYGRASFLVPHATEHMPISDPRGAAIASEIRQKVTCYRDQFDPDEAQWVSRRTGMQYRAALGTVSDTAGGTLMSFPVLGEMIELQRNMEVFPKAGAREITLPPNGRIQFPKLTGGATAYWVGEATAITESTPTTGNLDLQAKKLGLFVKLNNELLRFASPSADALVRMDMARVGAIKADLAMLEGTGGLQIKGLITYSDITTHVAFTVGSNGNTFAPEDVALMESKLPDAVDAPTAWIMRKNFFPYIMNRRADAANTGDAAGQFLFFPMRRSPADPPPMDLWGTPIIRSAQVSNTRIKGGGTTLTYVILGYFPDWIIARMGVMEFLASALGDTPLQYDQTHVRGIQFLDAGPRHGASFVLCDTLLVA